MKDDKRFIKPNRENLTVVSTGKFLEFKTVDIDNQKYEYVSRVNNAQAVVIIPVVKCYEVDRYIVIRQYRPTVDAYVWEFPAGLIDKDESIEDAAWRELYEETGLPGVPHIDNGVKVVAKNLLSSSGLTDEVINIVKLDIVGIIPVTSEDFLSEKFKESLSEELKKEADKIISYMLTLDELKELVYNNKNNDYISSRLAAAIVGL